MQLNSRAPAPAHPSQPLVSHAPLPDNSAGTEAGAPPPLRDGADLASAIGSLQVGNRARDGLGAKGREHVMVPIPHRQTYHLLPWWLG